LASPQITVTPPLVAPLLVATDLACRRADRRLFQGLNLSLEPGQLVWIRGDNGRGKTSLLRLLAGLSAPDQGRVRWVQQATINLDDDDETHGGALLYIGHHNALKDDLTALEALQFLARLHGCTHDTASITAALEAMGVKNQRNALVRTLSQGQRRRVALARLALQAKALVWVLDEPFDALDLEGIDRLKRLLQAHRLGGGAVALTSHQSVLLPGATELDLNAYVGGAR
jgi:heme exporter protein A